MWSIRLASIGDISRNNKKQKRQIIPVQNPILIGMLQASEEQTADYELRNINAKAIKKQIKTKKPMLEKIIEKAEITTAIQIHPKYRHISRYHAIIGLSQNSLYVADLESRNGTYIDCKRISPEKPEKAGSLQTIQLGGIKEDNVEIKAYKKAEKINALLVAADYKNKARKTVDTEISEIKNALRKTSTPVYIETLIHEQATKTAINHALKKAAEIPEDQIFLFYLNAHGNKELIKTQENTDLSKSYLSLMLNSIKAQKIIIIDSCHAAAGWQLLEDNENSMIFYSAKEDELSYYGNFISEFMKKINEQIEKRHPTDLKSLEIKIEKQTPVRKGNKSVLLW